MEFNIDNLVPVTKPSLAYRVKEKTVTAIVLIAHVLMLIGIIGALTLPFPIGLTIFSSGLVVLSLAFVIACVPNFLPCFKGTAVSTLVENNRG